MKNVTIFFLYFTADIKALIFIFLLIPVFVESPCLSSGVNVGLLCSFTEYAAINSMLDQINSYLDDLEDRNDALNGKLHELLESNRQARLEFRAQILESQNQEEQSIQGGDQSAELSASPSNKEEQNTNKGSEINDKSA